ncbi:SDR family NAD(P)-dependent oxidoreductase [Euzebya tangerina]|uniref:SDR family NAD(P)-dependent oxidoreductase n=1 Tax=Euzebya tangerina TaxID=591198 RepID=UPI000E32416D|nr:SDR family oxidoreductase [Euzebya tangerina]
MTTSDTPDPALPSFDLAGRVALVTGASRGIGRGLIDALAQAGATVAAACRNPDDLADAGPGILPYALDVTDTDQITATVNEIVADHGQLDILVANAGLGDNHPAVDVTPEDWDRMMAVNLKGLFFTCQAAGRVMLQQGHGRVIAMSSQASVVGIPDHAVYAASKGGVNQLVRVLALEWGPHGVTVNGVAPTFIRTPGTAERLDDPAFNASVVDRIPVGHVGSISDVAGAVVYLASDAGRMVNGSILMVDGGWTAR